MSYLVTYKGKRFDLPSPKPEQIDIVDIATHLSRIPRFVGATSRFVSVAQHSISVAYLSVAIAQYYATPPHLEITVLLEMLKEGLLHDAHEAYTGDTPSPVKALVPAIRDAEGRLDRVIRAKFGLKWDQSPNVKLADTISLILESDHLRGPGKLDYDRLSPVARDLKEKLSNGIGAEWFELAKLTIQQDWPHETAKDKFLKEWHRLEGCTRPNGHP